TRTTPLVAVSTQPMRLSNVVFPEPDDNMVPAALKLLGQRQKKEPRVERDVRRVLEDKDVTALSVAAPDHWHALATIWVGQAGMQRRSAAHFTSARELIRSGKLGKVPYVQTWIAGHRKSIGKKADAPAPAGVDYDLWLGPAPQRPFNPNRFHYNWHWNWD